MPVRPRAAVTVVAMTMLLGGCSGVAERPGPSAASTGSRTSTAAAPVSPPEPTGDDGGSVADRVVAQRSVAVAGRPTERVTVGVTALRVDGKLMVLRVLLTPHFAATDNQDQPVSAYDLLDGFFSPYLVDGEHLKKYSVIHSEDSIERWVADAKAVTAGKDSPMMVWAYFAAPQDNIRTIDVRVADAWPVFRDVPISP